MPKREVSSDAIRKPAGVFSQATVVEAKGKLVFISGMTARRPDGSIAGVGDISAQTRQVCENIKAAVEAAGGLHHGRGHQDGVGRLSHRDQRHRRGRRLTYGRE